MAPNSILVAGFLTAHRNGVVVHLIEKSTGTSNDHSTVIVTEVWQGKTSRSDIVSVLKWLSQIHDGNIIEDLAGII